MINDLTKYKQALILQKDIKEARLILKTFFKELNQYKKYIPIKRVLNEILTSEIDLKKYEEIFKEVVENKGRIDEK